MDFGKLAGKAKKLVEQRGGVDALKADAMQLKDIAAGDGGLAAKAQAAASALKDPGAARAGGEAKGKPADAAEQAAADAANVTTEAPVAAANEAGTGSPAPEQQG